MSTNFGLHNEVTWNAHYFSRKTNDSTSHSILDVFANRRIHEHFEIVRCRIYAMFDVCLFYWMTFVSYENHTFSREKSMATTKTAFKEVCLQLIIVKFRPIIAHTTKTFLFVFWANLPQLVNVSFFQCFYYIFLGSVSKWKMKKISNSKNCHHSAYTNVSDKSKTDARNGFEACTLYMLAMS